MAKEAIEYDEGTLLKLHSFVIGNCLGIRDACYILKATNERRQVIYQVDFSDIHPYIFPGKTKSDIERNSQSYHGAALQCLWELMFGVEHPGWEHTFRELPFRLALGPGTRLEVLEALWHAERRMLRKFKKYVRPIVPHVRFTKRGVYIPDPQKFYRIMAKWDHRKFLPQLYEAVGDAALKQDLEKPVGSLTFLFQARVLQNLEECLPEAILDEVALQGYPQDIEIYTKKLYGRKHRAADTGPWAHAHDKFHDTIDDINIALAYSIRQADRQNRYYVPVLSHTGRLITVGTDLKQYADSMLVNHTLAPLYIVRGIREHSVEELPSFLGFGGALAIRILGEMRQVDRLGELLAIKPYNLLKKRLKEKRPVPIPEPLMSKLEMFSREYYNLIEGVTGRPSAEGDKQELKSRPITVADVVELFNRTIEFSAKARSHAGSVKDMFEGRNCVLAGIFGDLGPHAQNLDNWLASQEAIDIESELESEVG